MAASALAIRLYEVDNGSRPETLDDLVPDYVATVPLDPFSDSDDPLRYVPVADPAILYSVGLNGVDDGGTFAFRQFGVIHDEKLDLPFFLDGNRPRSRADLEGNDRPSAPADEDHDDHKAEEGDSEEDEPAEQGP